MKSRLLICLAILAWVGCIKHNRSIAAENDKPNVLFIAVDDLRAELGCYGARHVQSPNIDRFAKTALRFERAYCQQAVCNPSRTSLMTGLRPDTIGVTHNHVHFRSNLPDVQTLPQYFKNHGYHAQAIGKIYHGLFPKGSSKTSWDTLGDPQSWSVPAQRFGPRYYYTEAGIAEARKAFQSMYRPKNPGPEDWTKKLVFGPATEAPDVADGQLYDGQVANAAIAALRKYQADPDQPFFLAVGFIKPHSPYIAPKKYFDLYDPGQIEIATHTQLPKGTGKIAGHNSGELRRYTDQPNRGSFSEQNQRQIRHAYLACTSYIDQQIGNVLAELDRLQLSKNTIVVLFGDHGYHLGEQGLWGKTTNFELDTRVPLIVRFPGMKSSGQSSKSLVELVDLYPTLCDLAGLSVSKQLEGKSFRRILEDPKSETKSLAFSQYPRGKAMGYSVRSRNHRLTCWIRNSEIVETEFYQYDDQYPIESENLASQPNLDQASQQVFTLSKTEILRWHSIALAKSKDFAEKRKQKSRRGFGPNSTSFEDDTAGQLSLTRNQVGTWKAEKGHARIDNAHAKSGTQCLHLVGGSKRTATLILANHINTNGKLTFWAERWTAREPFEFQVEKYSAGKWSQIATGDRTIRVGRSFLSKVEINLADPEIQQIRFRCSSPAGVLIDDVRFHTPKKQKIQSVEVQPQTLPAMIGSDTNALFRIRVVCDGDLDPVSVTSLQAKLDNNSIANVHSVRAYFTDEKTSMSQLTEFGKPIAASKNRMEFRGSQQLADGENYFWVTCKINKEAKIDQIVGAKCFGLNFSNGQTATVDQPKLFHQRLAVAVRCSGDDGVHTFRIPGLVTTARGTLIAVYDVRHRSGGDLPGDIDVGMSRSVDGGRTWEKMKIITDMGGDPKFNYDGVGDPAVLVDQTTGTIWVASTWSHGNRSWNGSGPGLKPEQTGQFILVKSDDDGKTWSKPINITKQIKKPQWCFLLQGPGKGITLSDGTIAFAAQYQDPPNKNDRQRHRLPHSTIIYSRDHGKTWQVGTAAFDDTTEAQIVELTDGRLMINCRYNRESKRVVMITDDMGKTWKEHSTSRKSLIEPRSCMASLINVSRELGQGKTVWLLFSNPNSTSGRKHLTIKASKDQGQTWPLEHQLLIDQGNSRGYSCMTMVNDKTIGILYEGSQADLSFQRIPLNDVIGNDKTKALFSQTLSVSPLQKNSKPTDSPQAEQHKLQFAPIFSDNMVLQINRRTLIWGKAKPNTNVTVKIDSGTQRVRSDDQGIWVAKTLPVRYGKPWDEPFSIRASCDGQWVEIKNVVVGDVWICAGQSNMEWPVGKSKNADNALATPADKNLRILDFRGALRGGSGIYGEKASQQLQPDKFSRGKWVVDRPQARNDTSAVAYYFAQKLRKHHKYPIGIINVSIGGSPIEAWIPRSTLADHPQLNAMTSGDWLENPVLGKWCRQRGKYNLQRGISRELEFPADRLGINHSFKPGFMFEASVEPFTKIGCTGVIWYQGESNADSTERVQQYQQLFPLLVQSWRDAFQNKGLPFLHVQLPGLNRPYWPHFREAQRRATQSLENVQMVVAIDVGDQKNVHPTHKQPIGKRLAEAWIRMQGKNKQESVLRIDRKSIDGPKTIIIEVASGKRKLISKDKKPLRHFEIAGLDGKYYAADAVINGDKIVVTCDQVGRVLDVRYAWSPYPDPPINLYFDDGSPVPPFTTQREFLK